MTHSVETLVRTRNRGVSIFRELTRKPHTRHMSDHTGVTRNGEHAPPLGWSYAPQHRPTVGP